jgi:Cu2+-containing amine oxidase
MAVNTQISESVVRPAHPLEALTGAEIESAAAVLRKDPRLTSGSRNRRRKRSRRSMPVLRLSDASE